MFATGPRRRKGLEFVCLFGHDGHRQHARLDARRVQEVVTLPRAFWRFVVRTSVDLECFYPTPELGVSDWTGRLAHGGQRHAQPPGPARLDDRRRDNIEVQLGEVKGVERCLVHMLLVHEDVDVRVPARPILPGAGLLIPRRGQASRRS